MKRTVALVSLALGVLFVLADPTWALRKSRREVEGLLRGDERYVDLSVELLTVRSDPRGEALTGDPTIKLSIVARRVFGGLFDTLNRDWAGPPLSPVTWLVSEEQEPLVLHAPDAPDGMWMQGSMGAGKTTAGAIWLGLRVIEHATHPIKAAGVTAPTDKRMEGLRTALFGPKDRNGERIGGMWPRSWATFREGDQVATTCTGLQIDFRSTHIQSSTAGSPIQGFNWAFALSDELQDYYDLDGDIQMRGRAAYAGRFQRFASVTPKDDPGYRTFRDRVEADETWMVKSVLGPHSPFVAESYWVKRKASMGEREYQRKVLAMDVLPEGVVYNSWSRDGNLRPLPQVPRWPDVTARELGRWGRGLEVLVGYDPGRLFDVSILLKAYQPPVPAATRQVPRPSLPDPVWFVVGEVTTERSTTEHHCRALLEVLRKQWGCNLGGDGAQAFVRGDPATTSGTDEEAPDTSVYTTFAKHGLLMKAAAYKPGSVSHGRVPKEGRIDMINTLLCSADGTRRLLVQCDDRKQPVAKKLVDALERMERDGDGKAERGRKDKSDLSHWPCALGYALWSIEKPRLDTRAA